MGGLCLLAELHRWRVCICRLRSRLVYSYIGGTEMLKFWPKPSAGAKKVPVTDRPVLELNLFSQIRPLGKFSLLVLMFVTAESFPSWKPRFPVDWTLLVQEHIANIGLLLQMFLIIQLNEDFFYYSMKGRFVLLLVILWFC